LRANVRRAKGSGKEESRDDSRLETLLGEERWGKADIGQASDNGGSAVEVGGAGNRSLHQQEHVREGVGVVAGGAGSRWRSGWEFWLYALRSPPKEMSVELLMLTAEGWGNSYSGTVLTGGLEYFRDEEGDAVWW
jgi:hypothetical protein